ncbi:MAG TPA: hypothetical protein VEC60_08625 [Reyranella sp.]|nr:hypothetical protein [Reyranella sp.]
MSYEAAVAQAAALPARRPASGVWQQGSVVTVNYAALGAYASQTAQRFAMPAAQPIGTVQQSGPVTVDYSVLQ